MPYTLNGFGTRFYGRRDRGADGSYVTTKWVTALYVPLVPLASYRVLPTGKSTSYVVHHSQNYLTQRVPICWSQVRNVYLAGSPLLLAILFFSWPSIRHAFEPQASAPSHTTRISEPEPFDPRRDNPDFDSIHPAPAKTMANSLRGPCGQVLKLDNEVALKRMDAIDTVSKLVDSSGFSNEDLNRFGLPRPKMEDAVSQAYGFGYIMWNTPGGDSEVDFRQLVDNAVSSAKPSSQEDAVAIQKFESTMLKAFDLGLYDANRNPCPF